MQTSHESPRLFRRWVVQLDFLVKLKRGTYALVEYKGGHLADSSDTREKRLLGELWAERGGGKFIMATSRDDTGRDLATQLREFFR